MRKNGKKNLVVAVLLAGLSLSALATETGSSLHLDPGKSYAEAVASAEKGNWKAADMELEEAKQLRPDLSFAPTSEVASLQTKIYCGEQQDKNKYMKWLNYYSIFLVVVMGFMSFVVYPKLDQMLTRSEEREQANARAGYPPEPRPIGEQIITISVIVILVIAWIPVFVFPVFI